MIRAFTIVTTARAVPRIRRRWAWVRIYRDLAGMRDAAGRDCPQQDFTDAYGVFTPRIHPQESGYVGVLRLAATHLRTVVVAHELVHVALAAYRSGNNADVRLGTQVGAREEALAYMYGDLYTDFERRFTHPLRS